MPVRTAAIVAILIFVHQPARAEFYSGNDLVQKCRETTNSASSAACLAFVAGIYDTILFYQSGARVRKVICAPKEASIGQLKEIVMRRLETHPAEAQFSAASIAYAAFQEVFRCR